MDQSLIDLGNQIVEELELERETEKWMAHYLAEAMSKAQTSTESDEGEAAAEKAEKLIRFLWEERRKRTEADAARLAGSAFAYEPTVRAEITTVVSEALVRMRGGKKPQRRTYRDFAVLLLAVGIVKEDLLRILLLGSNSDAGADVRDVAWHLDFVLHRIDDVVETLPGLSGIDLSKPRTAQRLIREQLAELSQLEQWIIAGK
jgi:hypothetical protein